MTVGAQPSVVRDIARETPSFWPLGSNRQALVSLVVSALLVTSGFAIITQAPGESSGRILQHFLSVGVQTIAAVLAALFVWSAGRREPVTRREQKLSRRSAAATLVWAVAFLAYTIPEWLGGSPAYPGTTEALFAVAFLIAAGAAGAEIRRLSSLLTRRQWGLVATGAGAVWVVAMRSHFWPILTSPVSILGQSFALFYALVAALLLSWGAVALAAVRGRAGVHAAVLAAGLFLVVLGHMGFAELSLLGLYSAVHPITLLRVGGFALLVSAGVWAQTSQHEHVGERTHSRERAPWRGQVWPTTLTIRHRRRPPHGKALPGVRGSLSGTIGRLRAHRIWRTAVMADSSLLMSLAVGIAVGIIAVVLLIVSGLGSRAGP